MENVIPCISLYYWYVFTLIRLVNVHCTLYADPRWNRFQFQNLWWRILVNWFTKTKLNNRFPYKSIQFDESIHYCWHALIDSSVINQFSSARLLKIDSCYVSIDSWLQISKSKFQRKALLAMSSEYALQMLWVRMMVSLIEYNVFCSIMCP